MTSGRRHFFAAIALLSSGLLAGCAGAPDGVRVVTDFELDRYLGTWHEIARLDHRFERGMSNVTAHYSLRDDGGVNVTNRGYKDDKGEWDDAIGKAYFVGEPDIGQLKVSFFGPFYGGYNIIALDQENYQYSMVAGPDRDYLWILARTPQLEPGILATLVEQAKTLQFETEALIYVDQSQNN